MADKGGALPLPRARVSESFALFYLHFYTNKIVIY